MEVTLTIGADVGTNLIDGHVTQSLSLLRCLRADVGTNLIDGHAEDAERILCARHGADVGTNLIDGHESSRRS